MHALNHRNFAAHTDAVYVAASKPEPGSAIPPDRTQQRPAGASGRFGGNGGARLLFAWAVSLLLLLSVLAGALPAQAQLLGFPSEPQLLTAIAKDGRVDLNWSAPVDSGSSSIEYYETRHAQGLLIPASTTWTSVGDSTSSVFRQLTNGVLYAFQVRAVNGNGHGRTARIWAIPNIPATVSVSAVQATVTEGADAVFRFSRDERTDESLTVNVDISGHRKIMSAATRALMDNAGPSPDVTVTFAAGASETTLAVASEADLENEGDGEISVTLKNAAEYRVGSDRSATVLVEDDDIPVVSLRWISPPMTVQGDTWVGSMVEGQDIEFEVVCTGGTLAPDGEFFRIPVHYREELNHPQRRTYGTDFKIRFPCSDQLVDGFLTSLNAGDRRFVGPDNGRLAIDILPQVRHMHDLPGNVTGVHHECYGSPDDVRFCPKFSFGSVTAVDIEVLNRNPTVTVEAVDAEVGEGEPARFRLTRIWASDWLTPENLLGPSTTFDYTISAVGGYASSRQNQQETFGPAETEIIVEIPTESDGVVADDGTVTFEILPGGAETQTGNLGGHYEAYDQIDGVTPPGGNSRMASVRILNRDEAGVDVSASALTVPEGNSRTYTVALISQPTGPVTVVPSVAGSPDVTVSPASLTFTAATWNQAQTVTVAAAQDDDAANDAATVSHAVSGADYGAVTAAAVSVTVADDDTASTGIALSASPDTVDEDAGATAVQVTGALNAAPRTSDTEVTVSVSAGTASSGDFAAVPDFTLTIPAGQTEGTASFSLAPVDDAIDEGAETLSIVGTAQGLTVTGGTVTVADDDTAGVDVSASALTVPEGDSRTYTVALSSQPTGPVTVVPSVAGSPDVTASPASLTFTAATWNQAQTVTVSAAEDDDAANDAATVSHAVSGADYGAVTADAVSVTVEDDETASTGVALSVSPDTVDEDAGATAVQVTGALNAAPRTSDTEVTVSVSARTASAGDFAAVPDFTLTIPAGQTEGTASFSLTPVDDALDEVAETISIGGTAQGLTVTAATLEIDDNDRRGVNVSAARLVVPEGVSQNYSVTLRSQPTGPVTVAVSAAGSPDVTVSPAALSFTAANWNQRQSVTVSAAQDDDAADDAATLSHAASGGDYGTVTGSTIPVTVPDDDTAGVDVSESALTVPEGDSRTYTVALRSQPTGPVTVTLSAAGDPDVTVSPASLSFTAANWNQAQTVTVSAAQDDDSANDAATVSHAVSGADYGAVTAAAVSVTVADDDTLGVDVSASALTVPEGDSRTYTVALRSQPTGPVTVVPSVAGSPDVTASPASLTFTAATWNQAQTVTVSAAQDDDSANDAATVSHAVSGADYGAVTAAAVSVTVADDDTGSLILTIVPHDDVDTIVEGEYARFDVLLSGPITEWIEVDARYAYTGDMMVSYTSSDTRQYGPRSQQSTMQRVIATLDDSAIEPDGSITVRLLPGHGYTLGEQSSATIRILDNDGGRAPAAPAAPTVSALSPTVLEAIWHAPVDRGNPGTIDSYDVQYRKAGEAAWLDGPAGLTDTRAVLEGLEAGASYEVRVLARNARNPWNADGSVAENWSAPGAGSTAPSPAVTVSVAELPGSPQAREGDVLEFVVTADPPPASDLRVEVEVSESGAMLQAPAPTAVVVAAGTGEVALEVATVDDAAHETPSEVTVSIVPGPGYNRGEAVTRRLVSDNDLPGPGGVPGQPRNPHAEPMSDTELRLTWDWPLDIARDQITSWVVSWAIEPCTVGSPSWEASGSLPAGAGDPTEYVLTVGENLAAHFRVAAIRADAEIGPWSEAVCADTTADAQFESAGARVANGPGGNGVWDAGETVEAELTFNRPVWVDDTNGRPSLAIVLDGVRREAPWVGGGGTSTLLFAYPVTAIEAGARVARVLPNGLSLNGGTVRDAEGRYAPEHIDVTPVVTAVTVEADSDGLWSPGDEARVHVTFNEPVTVDTQGGRPSLGIVVGTAPATRAAYVSGSGSPKLVFAYAIADAVVPASSVVVLANTLSLEGGAIRGRGLAADLRHPGARLEGTSSGPLPAFSVADAEANEGGRLAFVVTLDPASQEEVTVAYTTSDESASAGTDYALAAGRLTFAPGETRVVAEVAVHEDRIDEGVETLAFTLSGPSGAEIAKAQATGRIVDASALTASFVDVPAEHDGSSIFTFRLAFSEAPQVGFRTLRDEALTATGGTVKRVRRVVQGQNDLWEIHVEPAGNGAVTVALGPSPDCGEAGAICTADDEALVNVPSVTIQGPSGLSVADAEVQEGPGAALAFAVTLSRASSSTVTVDYETADGSATAGADYTATSGTLTFAAGETAKTVTVPVLVDSIDKGSETLTLTLSGPSGAEIAQAQATGRIADAPAVLPGLWIADATVQEGVGAVLEFAVTLEHAASGPVTVDWFTIDGTATAGEDFVQAEGTLTFAPGETAKTIEVAVLDDSHDEALEVMIVDLSNPSGARLARSGAVGWIENSDPIPQAWIARFGRTVADHVIDAAQGRMTAPRTEDVELTLAGRHALDGAASDVEGGGADELISGSSFAFTRGSAETGFGSLWGRGAISGFDGREGDLGLSGEVTSAIIGADWTGERSTAGLLLSHAQGEGTFRGASAGGTVESAVTGLYPYGRYALTDGVTVWGVAGYGVGTLTLTPEPAAGADPEDRRALRTDMDLMMAAAGLRGVVVEAPAEGGPEVSVETDALAVRTRTEALRSDAGNLAAATGDATLLRLGLHGTWRGLEVAGGVLEPKLELGVRHDGGDAETGFGLDAGAGLAWSHPENGLLLQLSGRGLLTHESAGFREQGVAGSLAWQPRPERGRGPKLTLTQSLGGASSGGADALLGRPTLAGLAANDHGDPLESRSLEVRYGYGFPAFGDRFTSTPEIGFGMSNGHREYSLGWRLNLDQVGTSALEFALEASRREAVNDNGAGGSGAEPEHTAGFRIMASW